MTIISNHQQLLRFAGLVLGTIDTHRNAGYGGPADIDGGDLREQAVACGLLEKRTVDSPCRPSCACDRFPVQCYFLTPLGEQAASEMDAPPDDADLPTLESFAGVGKNALEFLFDPKLLDIMDDDTPDHSEPGPAAVDAEYVAQLLAERDKLRAEVERLNAVLDQADAVTRRIDAAVDRATENATRLIAERDKLRALLAEALRYVGLAAYAPQEAGVPREIVHRAKDLVELIAAALPQVAD